MMVNLRSLASGVLNWLRRVNPFLVLLCCLLIIWVLPSEYSIWKQLKYSRELTAQEHEIKELQKKIDKAKADKKELLVQRDRLEKFARERYLMKEEDEDIYLLTD